MDETSRGTLAHYDARAVAFEAGTRDHDVTENYAALLDAIDPATPPPLALLDFGCGPGRDLRYFKSLGHVAVGLDGSAPLVAMARESGCEVLHQDFLSIDLGERRFHGVFANASLFHVPSAHLHGVLTKLHDALLPGGVLFSSNPRGDDFEGWNAGRYGCWWSLEAWTRLVTAAGFDEVRHYYRPAGRPRSEQPWLASVWRKRA